MQGQQEKTQTVAPIVEQAVARVDDTSSEPASSRDDASSSYPSLTQSSGQSSGSSSHNTFSFARVAEKESKQVFRSKILVLIVLMISAVVVGVAAFFALQKEAEKKFETDVSENDRIQGRPVKVESNHRLTTILDDFLPSRALSVQNGVQATL